MGRAMQDVTGRKFIMRVRRWARPNAEMNPQPTSVQYNDWRQVEVPAPETFTPTMPVTVIIPSWRTPAETLARTLASLEG